MAYAIYELDSAGNPVRRVDSVGPVETDAWAAMLKYYQLDHDRQAILRPGDKLLLCAASDLSTEDRDRLCVQVGERFPNVDVTVIAGVDDMLVYRGGS